MDRDNIPRCSKDLCLRDEIISQLGREIAEKDERLADIAEHGAAYIEKAEADIKAAEARVAELEACLDNVLDKHALWLHPGGEECKGCELRDEIGALRKVGKR